jgi:hypothetical protein
VVWPRGLRVPATQVEENACFDRAVRAGNTHVLKSGGWGDHGKGQRAPPDAPTVVNTHGVVSKEHYSQLRHMHAHLYVIGCKRGCVCVVRGGLSARVHVCLIACGCWCGCAFGLPRSVGKTLSRTVGMTVSRTVGMTVSRTVGTTVSRTVGWT